MQIENNEIYVKLIYPNDEVDQKKLDSYKQRLPINIKIPVTNIEMGQSNSTIELEGNSGIYNSIFFEFCDKNDNKVDIFKTKYNPYRRVFFNKE